MGAESLIYLIHTLVLFGYTHFGCRVRWRYSFVGLSKQKRAVFDMLRGSTASDFSYFITFSERRWLLPLFHRARLSAFGGFLRLRIDGECATRV